MSVTIHRKEKQIHNFLKDHRVGVLATVTPDGEPHAATIYYTVANDLDIRFLTRDKTQKAINLLHNNHAALVVYDAATQTTVQLSGTVTKITDNAEINAVYRQVVYASLDTSNNDIPPVAKLDAGDYITYRLTPTKLYMAVFNHAKPNDYKDIFEVTIEK